MSKSVRLTNQQVQLTVRAAWEAAELRHDPFGQGRFLSDKLCELIGADFGFWCTLAEFLPTKHPRLVFAVCGSVQPGEMLKYFAASGREFSSLEDPAIDLGRHVGRTASLRMSDLLRHCD